MPLQQQALFISSITLKQPKNDPKYLAQSPTSTANLEPLFTPK
jgi:hypothetical protein